MKKPLFERRLQHLSNGSMGWGTGAGVGVGVGTFIGLAHLSLNQSVARTTPAVGMEKKIKTRANMASDRKADSRLV